MRVPPCRAFSDGSITDRGVFMKPSGSFRMRDGRRCPTVLTTRAPRVMPYPHPYLTRPISPDTRVPPTLAPPLSSAFAAGPSLHSVVHSRSVTSLPGGAGPFIGHTVLPRVLTRRGAGQRVAHTREEMGLSSGQSQPTPCESGFFGSQRVAQLPPKTRERGTLPVPVP
jgi:hypothetical protein